MLATGGGIAWFLFLRQRRSTRALRRQRLAARLTRKATAHKPLSPTRLAWVFPPRAGDIGALELREESIEEPVLGEVRVRVKAVGLNFADVFTGLGLYAPIKSGEVGSEVGGFVPGLEFSGVVECVGRESRRPGATRAHGGQLCELSDDVWAFARTSAGNLKVGDRVMGAMRFGAYASFVNVPAHQVRHMPIGWTFEEGAAFLVQALTASYGLRALGVAQEGHTALIHSAAGGCGQQAIAICLRMGVKVVGTVGSTSKVVGLLQRFPELSPQQIIVRQRGHALEGQLREALSSVDSAGFNVVLDAVLGDVFQPGFNCLLPGGRYVVFGAASMTPQVDRIGLVQWAKLAWRWLRRPFVDTLQLPGSNKAVMGFNLIYCFEDARNLAALLDGLLALDLPRPHLDRVLPFESGCQEALRALRSGATSGKVLLRMSDGE